MAAKKEEEFRFLMVGKSGSGKSSTGNTIFGEELFVRGFGLASGTKTCEYRRSSKPKKGVKFVIVDTPGLFDPTRPNGEIAEEIIKASTYLHPGPHAILYIVQIDRYTPEERDTFLHLKELFDPNIVKFTIIIFTRGDELKKNKMTLKALLEKADETFKEVQKECGNRVLVFNNVDRRKRDEQVKPLLEMVREIAKENGENPYRCTVQDVVNTKLERRVTVRVNEKIEKDPNLKKVFDDMAKQVKEAKESSVKRQKELEESLMKTEIIEKKIQEGLEAKEKERQMKEQKEREEKERKEREDREKQEKAEREKREEEERKRKQEEEKERKRREEEDRKRMEELVRELQKIKLENEMKEKLAQEVRKQQEEYERRLEEERRKHEEEERNNTKEDVAAGKEKHWMGEVVGGVADAAGGMWRAAKGWLGF